MPLFNNATTGMSLITYCLLYNCGTASSNSSKYVKRIVHAGVHSSNFEGKCISGESKLEERNQEILLQNFVHATEIWCNFVEVIKAKVAGSMPTCLAFPEQVAEGFQIVFLTTLEFLILRLLH